MKKLMAAILALALLLGLSGCKASGKDLKFYIIDRAAVSSNASDDQLLAAAKKSGRIAFTGDDIKSWYWQDHKIELKEVRVKGGTVHGGSALFQTDGDDLFILALNGRVVFVGGFESTAPAAGIQREIYIKDGEGDAFSICCTEVYEPQADPRNDAALYEYLADMNLLIGQEARK